MSTNTLTLLSRGWSMFLLLETGWAFEIVLMNLGRAEGCYVSKVTTGFETSPKSFIKVSFTQQIFYYVSAMYQALC